MATTTLKVPNINCHHCVMTIKRELGAVDGVEKVEGEVSSQTITLSYRDANALAKAKAALAEIGYPAKE